jgi:aryl-alcohol dehydrogenase-like predicted oxidoreductase
MMRYTLLGESGLRVSQLCLGTMTFGTDWGWGADEAEAGRQLKAFVDAGGNFIDTANNYTNGSSEAIVGRLLSGQRERFVVATKYSLSTRADDLNAGGNHRKSLVQALEASLRRLGSDYVDILWLHAWDYLTPPEEVMRALDDQVRSGKVLYVGISDTPAWVVAHLQTLARLRGWSPFAGLQIPYSLAQREVESELTPMARGLGLGVTAWAPLGGGLLTGKYNRPGERDQPRRLGEVTEDDLRIAQEVVDVADQHRVSASRVALAWLLSKNVIPVLGARTSDQLIDNLGCLDLDLPASDLARLDEASAHPLGFPHDFLASRDFIHDGGRRLLDLPPGRHEFGR